MKKKTAYSKNQSKRRRKTQVKIEYAPAFSINAGKWAK